MGNRGCTRIKDYRVFNRWLRSARPGDCCCYHEGWLVTDRELNKDLDILAYLVLDSLERGLVHPFQTSMKDGSPGHRYLAIRSRVSFKLSENECNSSISRLLMHLSILRKHLSESEILRKTNLNPALINLYKTKEMQIPPSTAKKVVRLSNLYTMFDF